MTPFNELLAREAGELMPDATVTITGPTTLQLVRGSVTSTLDGALAEYESRGKSATDVVERIRAFLRGTTHAEPFSWVMPADQLYPVVRPAGLANSELGGQLAALPFGEYFNIHLAIDNPDGFTLVDKESLERWGVTFEAALELAIDNLRRDGIDTEVATNATTGAQLMQVTGPYGYQPSWVVDTDAIALLHRFELNNEAGERFAAISTPVVLFIPNRSDLLVVPQTMTDSLQWALEESWSQYHEHPRPVAPCGLVYAESGGLTFWEPPADHPAHEAQSRAVARFVADETGPDTPRP